MARALFDVYKGTEYETGLSTACKLIKETKAKLAEANEKLFANSRSFPFTTTEQEKDSKDKLLFYF
jgi:hypothetical protein